MADAPNIPDVVDLTIERIHQGLEDGEFTCLDLCEVYLVRIAEVNDDLHAVIQTNPDVKAVAASRDADYESGAPRGALHGIPILVKNLFHINDKMLTTAGSLALVGSHGPVSTVISNLEREGAIILGTTNLSEFANFRSEHCPDGWSPLGGQCYGVYAKNHNPSGSSSGSAVAARLGLAAACLGTENNGSITSPAAQASCVGFKPTVGLISRHGVMSFNEYQDCPGTLSRTVEDAARILSVIAGRDPADLITDSIPDIRLDFAAACKSSALQGVRFSVPRTDIMRDIKEPEILASFEATLDELRKHGATIVDNVRYPTWTPDFSRRTLPFVWDQLKTSVGRYLSSLLANPHNLQSLSDLWGHMNSLPAEETEKLGGTRFVKALEGPPMDSEEAFAARLAKGSEIAAVLDEHECDVIIVPEGFQNPADLGQSPVVCLPMGFYSSSASLETDEYGLTVKAPNIPFGVLLLGRKWEDHKLCAVAAAYERVIAQKMRGSDQPAFTPKTELRDVVKGRVEHEGVIGRHQA